MDLLSEDNLQAMIRCEAVGDRWPYAGGSHKDIEKHLNATVAELKRTPGISVDAEFGHYGSGYASYVDAFCCLRDRSTQQKRDGVLYIDGITVYLGRLAPLAVLSAQQKTKHESGGGYGFIYPTTVNTLPDGNWSDFVREIRTRITGCGFTFLDRETASQPLPFESEIPTILAEPPYSVFDAVFYWED